MYKHILVAVAFHEDQDYGKALKAAARLADADGRVTFLHVREAVPSSALAYIPSDYASEVRQEILDRLDRLAAQMENGSGVLVEGHSGRTILEWATKHDVDCIVIASHRPGLQDYFLGSTAGRVVRHATCSVHVTR
ncbi:universal stress protein [Ovoidimarina sediminis]|uniref:universal stress protein n=1 Tax=Ovoidimarina sediminis TaxID=3079856 RepID=UPI00290CE9BA|nr:universal stress protein [Rhodophyticola sp. MJ-SS7]MDU8945514.1 universal stress protein [Rhodophyticola sp. MJ-SS7]